MAILLLAASACAAEWPREKTYQGPMRFCSHFFAIDVARGERVIVRDPGLDFLLNYFETEGLRFGVYQGNHPQTGDREIRRVAPVSGVPVDRMTDGDNRTSYLIHAKPRGPPLDPDLPPEERTPEGIPVYLHVFSDQFTGDEADRTILERFVVGGFDKTGCERATYRWG